MKVLIAEDEPVSRRLIASLLGRWGYGVVTVKDGFEALQILQQADPPKLAVVDWMMPGLNGIQLCEKIRHETSNTYTYVLLLTGKHAQADVIRGLEAGADDYLTKPFDPPELRMRLTTGTRILDLMDQLVVSREAFRNLAAHDGLTGLWNHTAILEILANERHRSERYGSSIGVLLVDLDHFKSTNDTYGHLAGDLVLTEIAHRISSTVRPYDAVGRYGGEEFLIVLPGCDEITAVSHAERLRIAIGRSVVKTTDDREVRSSASIGVTVAEPGAHSSVDALIQAADTALYRAKRDGRDQVVFLPANSLVPI